MDKENKNSLTNNGAAPIEKNPFADFDFVYKNPLADYDGTPVPHTEEDDADFEEILEKIEEHRMMQFDRTIRFNFMTDEEADEELEYAKETADDEKR